MSYTRQQLVAQLDILMGGRVAEELFNGKDMVNTGASNDMMKATQIARRMVQEWGFSGAYLRRMSCPFCLVDTFDVAHTIWIVLVCRCGRTGTHAAVPGRQAGAGHARSVRRRDQENTQCAQLAACSVCGVGIEHRAPFCHHATHIPRRRTRVPRPSFLLTKARCTR